MRCSYFGVSSKPGHVCSTHLVKLVMLRYVGRFVTYFTSRIQFKIIAPFALLTLFVAGAGTYFSTRLLADSLEERFTRQLVAAGSTVADGLAQREQLHLSTLRTIVFTTGIDQAVLAEDRAQLQNLLFPIMVNNNIDRVDVISAAGHQVLTIYRPLKASSVEDYKIIQTDLVEWPLVDKVLNGMADAQGNKYVALQRMDGNEFFFTAGPVKQDDQIVGAVVVGSYTKNLLASLKQVTFADVNFYDIEGGLIGSTMPADMDTAAALAITPQEMRPLLALEGEASPRRLVSLNGHEYDLLYGIFWARGEPLGFYSVAMPTTFIKSQGASARNQMVIIFATALFLVFGMGYVTSSMITRRLQHLMENALAVAGGDFTRRTHIATNDEIGSLARSLDHMTMNLADYTQKLQDRINELMTLYESSSAVTIRSDLNLEHVLQVIINSVSGVIQGTDQVIIYLLDESSQALFPRAAAPRYVETYPALTFDHDGGIHNLLATPRPQIINPVDLKTDSPGLLVSPGVTGVLVVSLIAGQEVIGMLMLIPEANRPHDELLNSDSERLLRTLANQAAIAIKNAQLFETTQQAYEELRQLDTLKTEFINIAAHELRTPLGAMMGYATFAQKRVPTNLRKTMDFLVASTLRMRTMVDAMLAIQRMDTGAAFLRLGVVDIGRILQKTVTDFQLLAELEGHTITLHVPADLSPIQADGEKMDLIFSNLLSNAIKFTPKQGYIDITVQEEADSMVVSVHDNGVGIASEDQERIFERFYQVRVEHIAGHSGMGIGLTTVKYLVELHGGHIRVESDGVPGQGSTFFVTLPKMVTIPSAHTLPLTADIQFFDKELTVPV